MLNVLFGSGELCHKAKDFHLNGEIPFIIERVYRSDRRRVGRLGPGWSWPWCVALEWTGSQFVLDCDEGAIRETFEPEGGRAASFISQSGSMLVAEPDRVNLRRSDGFLYRFVNPTRLGRRSFLSVLEDAWGNRLTFENGPFGPRDLIDTAGRRLRFVYDTDGRVVFVDLVAGGVPGLPTRVVTYRYDREGDLVEVTDRSGAKRSYQYVDHLLVAVRNARGGAFYAAYDELGRCIRKWRGDGRLSTEIHFDPQRRRLRIVDALGVSTFLQLDEQGNLLEEERIDGCRLVNVYDGAGGLLATLVDGQLTSALRIETLDGTQSVTMVDASGRTFQHNLDTHTRSRILVDPSGATWMEEYGTKGELVRTTSPAGSVWTYRYDERGVPVSFTTPGGNTVQTEFSADYRAAEVRDSLGPLTRLRWDEEGRMVERSQAGSRPESYEYDPLGRVVAVFQPNGARVVFRRDPEGDVIGFMDALGGEWRIERNPYGEVLRETGPLGFTTEYEHDALARVIAIRNSAGRHSRRYDETGALVAEQFFDGREEQYSYDSLGHLARIEHSDGASTTYILDPGGRLLETVGADSVRAVYEYDGAGRVLLADRGGVVARFEYDAEGRVVLEEQGGRNIQRRYDQHGNRTSLDIDGIGVREYSYDLRNRLQTVRDFDGSGYAFAYDAGNRRIALAAGDGRRLESEYLPYGRVGTVRLRDGARVMEVQYEYDAAGREVERRLPAGNIVQYQFDSQGRLVGRQMDGRSERYEFGPDDALLTGPAGERIDSVPGGQAVAAGDRRYRRDARGRIVVREGSQGRTRYFYDDEDHLRRVENPDGTWIEFVYDAFGRRLFKRTEAGEIRYVWDGDAIVAEVQGDRLVATCLEDDATRVPLVRSQAGRLGLMLASRTGFPMTVAWSDGSWTVDLPSPWGRSALDAEARQRQPLRFAGQTEDQETGLHYNRHRYYDPELARFLTPDPLGIEASLNLYEYASDPVNWYDPLGLMATVTTHTCPGTSSTAKNKTDAPETLDRDCNSSNGSSIHNHCLNMAKDKAEAKGYTTRSDQMQENGPGRSNRPDLTLEMGKKSIYVEFDYEPGDRVTKHKNDICANDPGATIILVSLPQSDRFSTRRDGTKPSKPGSIQRSTGPTEQECGVDKIDTMI